MINVCIVGVSGFTGAEALRILLNHPRVGNIVLCADSNAGNEIANVYPFFSSYKLKKIVKIDEVDFTKIDVVFCCLPHGKSAEIIINLYDTYQHLKIIDLSADFRLKNNEAHYSVYGVKRTQNNAYQNSAYGLTELNRDVIRLKRIIACPGCYPTSAILPLYPLLKNEVIQKNSIIIDSKSGITGAGRKDSFQYSFVERADSVLAYGLFEHRHKPEIEQEINSSVIFTPHLVPAVRGIESTMYVKATGKYSVTEILKDFYKNEPFIQVVDFIPSTKEVSGTNICKIYAKQDKESDNVIIISVIDNLCKGSSGQAVQNMNVICGFEEGDGLCNLIPVLP